MVRSDRIFCFEAFDVCDPLVRAAERLYEQTQHPEERIPWGWIARSVKGRVGWRPGAWGKHLLVAMPEERAADPKALAGFLYGAHLPGFGGYVCYVGVAETVRRRGVGTRLYDQAFRVLAADACAVDEQLPFVVWESHKPGPTAPDADWKLWEARVRLFDRVGGLWIDGLELLTPNCSEDSDDPVALQLFVKPIDKTAFSADELRGIAAGLLERVYRSGPGEPLYDATMRSAREPRLRPAKEAGRRKEAERVLVGV